MRHLLAILLAAGSAAVTAAQSPSQRFDYVILGGRILDGAGNPWFRADVGITGDRIYQMASRNPGKKPVW